MRIVHGDALGYCIQGHFDVLVIPCNCQHIRTSPVAQRVYEQFPLVREQELHSSTGPGGVLCMQVNASAHAFYVISAYTQHAPRTRTDPEFIANILRYIKRHFAGRLIALTPIPDVEPAVLDALCQQELQGEIFAMIQQPGQADDDPPAAESVAKRRRHT